MRRLLARTGLATRLVIVLVVLIVLTTLSAGVPAYLLARSQLEQQAWEQVDATQRATESLYEASLGRVIDLTALLAERPTLRALVTDRDTAALESYLNGFMEQSDLDLSQLCDEDGAWITTGISLDLCAIAPDGGIVLVEGQPLMLARQAIRLEDSPETLGTVLSGLRLDAEFLAGLSANTGVEQTILAGEQPVSSTLPAGPVSVELSLSGQQIAAGEATYFARQFPLPGQTEGLYAAVALPVGRLRQTERDALLILFAGSSLVALAGAAVGAWFIRRMTAPLSELTHAAELISRGDLEAPIPRIADPPEVATLSTTLERSQTTMLAALEERLQARDWLDSLVQSVVEGVITFDTSGHVTFMSQGAVTMTGWTIEEAVGQPIGRLLPPADSRDGSRFVDYLPAAGEKREFETTTRSGKSLVLAATGARMVPPGGDTVQVALVLRDVTEEQALRNLRAFLLANISHEFRTPLSTLNASLELLMDQADSLSAVEIRELLKPTHLSLLSLQTLIDNLLESSRFEVGMSNLRLSPVALDEVLAEAMTIVRPLVERRRQVVAVTEPGRPPVLPADRARVTQALVNLLTNAAKYSPIGSVIDLIVEQKEAIIRLSVADRGPGISAEERSNLFRRFMRLHASGDQQYGVGLGLYLTKRIAEAHGGRVGVDDRPGGGAIFWIELPAQ